MATKLKIWNGGGYGVASEAECVKRGLRDSSACRVYACAASRAELIRMIEAYTGHGLRIGVQSHLRTHWIEGLWGRSMEGVEPTRGLWIQWGHTAKPVRVWPKEKASERRN